MTPPHNTRIITLLVVLLIAGLAVDGCTDSPLEPAYSTFPDGSSDVSSSGADTATTSSSGGMDVSSSGSDASSSSGAMDTSVSDAGDTNVGDMVMRTVCDDYCDAVMMNCTDDNEQYTTYDECLNACAVMPEGTPDDMAGVDSAYCRLYHADTPAEMDPAFHCPHAGADGGDVCVADQVTGCERFCANAMEACANEYAVYATIEDCTTACGDFPDTGSFGDPTGDTIQCRDRYAQLALPAEGDKILCLLTAPDGGGVCVDPTQDQRIDRMGRPAINTALINSTAVDATDPTDHKDLFNHATPADGSFFEAEMTFFIATIDGAFDNDDTNGLGPAIGGHAALASVLANDVLLFDATSDDCEGGYLALELSSLFAPLVGKCGGRTLAQDVMDATLQALVDAGGVTVVSDDVDADDGTPSAEFPYLDVPGN